MSASDIGGSGNEFFSLSASTTRFVAASNIMIGGRSQRVSKVMAYTDNWIQTNFYQPLCNLKSKTYSPWFEFITIKTSKTFNTFAYWPS